VVKSKEGAGQSSPRTGEEAVSRARARVGNAKWEGRGVLGCAFKGKMDDSPEPIKSDQDLKKH